MGVVVGIAANQWWANLKLKLILRCVPLKIWGRFYPWKLLKDIRMITLDVVTRYYRVACCLSCYCCSWLAFYHTGLYREYRIPVAFRCGLTADWRLHTARVCRRGSLVTFHGLTRIKLLRSAHLCWLDVTRAAGVGMALRCWPLKKLSPTAAIVLTRHHRLL